MMETLQVKSGDARLSVRVDGAEGLRWLVLSNSLATDLSLWDDQIPALTKIRRVARYDTRGHGASSAPDGPYSFDILVADMVAVMDALGIGEADIVGLSLGGMTAMGIALDHPGRVRKYVCSNARAIFPPAGLAMWDQRAALARDSGMAVIAEDTLPRWFTPATLESRPEVVDRARRQIVGTSQSGYIACTAALKGLDYLRRLGTVTRPALYIAGEADGAAPADAMREMAAATPGGRFEMVAGAAHIANMEKPEAYDRLLVDFLS
jgi:3-oxoadipate enol-lactonase